MRRLRTSWSGSLRLRQAFWVCGEWTVSTPDYGNSFNTEDTEENTESTEDVEDRAGTFWSTAHHSVSGSIVRVIRWCAVERKHPCLLRALRVFSCCGAPGLLDAGGVSGNVTAADSLATVGGDFI